MRVCETGCDFPHEGKPLAGGAVMQEAFDFAPARRQRNSLPPNGARVKRKGSGYERTVAAILRAIWPEAHRGDQRSSYFRVPDIDGSPIWWECKAGKRVNLHGAWRQAVEDWRTRGTAFRFPVVIARNDRQPDLVLLRLEDFLPMLAAWWAQEGRLPSDAPTARPGDERGFPGRLQGDPRP